MFQDVRFGVRMLLKNPGFTVTAMLSLIISIGATSAIFSAVNGSKCIGDKEREAWSSGFSLVVGFEGCTTSSTLPG
jgi:hypothetical protein